MFCFGFFLLLGVSCFTAFFGHFLFEFRFNSQLLQPHRISFYETKPTFTWHFSKMGLHVFTTVTDAFSGMTRAIPVASSDGLLTITNSDRHGELSSNCNWCFRLYFFNSSFGMATNFGPICWFPISCCFWFWTSPATHFDSFTTWRWHIATGTYGITPWHD